MVASPSCKMLAALAIFAGCSTASYSQWVAFTDSTASRMSYAATTTDPEEKDFALSDIDQDGDLDLLNARKEGFYGAGARTHILFMNVNGVLTDQTATLAPGFLSNPSLARVVVVADFDGDGWDDVVIANTDGQQPQFYWNLGSSGGNWLGLQYSTAGRFPTLTPGPLHCSAAAGDADNDGDMDLFLGDYNNTLENRLLINDGTGHFTDQSATRFAGGIPSSGFSSEATFVDFNNDGALDIMDTQAGSTGIHLNKSGGVVGQYTARILVNSSANYTSAAGDLTNDGKVDIYAGQDGQDAYLINTTAPGSMTLSFATTTLQSVNPAGANYSPHTTGFAGNPYIADVDNDGWRDIVMADTDVDAPGCSRRAVLTRNILPTTGSVSQVLTTPFGATLQNFNTQGTHDIAVLDLNGDGFMDLVSGLCVGYKVFIQIPPVPTGLTLSITEPVQGAIDLQISNATPSSAVYTLVTTQVVYPTGSGPFFGLSPDAFTTFVALYPLQPIAATTDPSGHYAFGVPAGAIPAGFQIQARSVQPVGASYDTSNIVTYQW